MYEFIALDLPALLTVGAAALACALLGNFLVLQRRSLIGDALSHAVLPGVVGAFLFTHSRGTWLVFIGAIVAAVLCSLLIEMVHKLGRIESSAAMGVVFSLFFAAGVLLMELAAARVVDLDADCLLHGQLESIFWYPPENLLRVSTLLALPSETLMSLLVLVVVLLFVALFWKELVLFSFDATLGNAIGYSGSVVSILLMAVIASAVVASFSAVGSILVIAMLICPAATMRFFTDRLRVQIGGSILFALASCCLGYFAATRLPQAFGAEHAVSAAGGIVTAMGFLFSAAAFFAPRYGIVPQWTRQRRFTRRSVEEDILALLYRVGEADGAHKVRASKVLEIQLKKHARLLPGLIRRDLIKRRGGEEISFTHRGRALASHLVRSHRLWESYLAEAAGVPPDHVHAAAERLEHATDPQLAKKLEEEQHFPSYDPHGRAIPSSHETKDAPTSAKRKR